MHDDASPRKPGDPPWRRRIAHRSCDPRAARLLELSRLRMRWSISEASRQAGVSRRMIKLLEQAQRRPSESLLEALISAYQMRPETADAVRTIAVTNAGRDSPYRTGVATPGDWNDRW